MSCSSSTLVSAKMLRMSSSTISTFLPASSWRRTGAAPRSMRLLRPRAARVRRRCRKSAVWSSSRSGDCTWRTRQRDRGARRSSCSCVELRRRRRSPASSLQLRGFASTARSRRRCRRRASGIEHDAIEAGAACQRSSIALAAAARRRRSTSPSPIELARSRSRLPRVGLDAPARALLGARDVALSASSSRVEHVLALHRLGDERRARRIRRRARAPPRSRSTHTGMWRVARSFFSRSSTRQPSMSGRQMSSVIASGV